MIAWVHALLNEDGNINLAIGNHPIATLSLAAARKLRNELNVVISKATTGSARIEGDDAYASLLDFEDPDWQGAEEV